MRTSMIAIAVVVVATVAVGSTVGSTVGRVECAIRRSRSSNNRRIRMFQQAIQGGESRRGFSILIGGAAIAITATISRRRSSSSSSSGC